MKLKSHKVSPLKRIAATIYDLFLLLGVWFLVGSVGLWLNNGEVLNPWLGLFMVFISTWSFYTYFWIHGNKTLGMAVWKIEIYSIDGKNVTIQQVSIRFIVNLLIVFFAGLPLLQIYFSKDGASISDHLSKTNLRYI
ncbi:RDD family protein [Gammaproteobacteria bacterium]|nr:RDD family protein [Gammaproteobacteria bacterium]MDA8865241.1 RDD family protein [Gammaproteobacteria bacterium]MDB4157255.1 RDD family protein [Gammaproteobacteria bacterium]MDC3180472.1 RDD family protein [bacterium]MDC3288707.1 RDD family protein [Gammaproteobacteria bacterium]